MKALRGLLLTGALIGAVAGCASGGASSGAAGETETRIPIVVNNNVVPPNTYTVWLVTSGGARYRLGTVSPNATGRFNYRLPGVGQYRLVADPRTGSSVRSNYMDLSEATAAVEWDLGSGSVVVR